MKLDPRTLALAAVSLAGSETGIAYIPVPLWARVCLGAVTAGTIVASAVDATKMQLEIDDLRALNEQPLWLRQQRENEEIVAAMITQQHEDVA